MVLFLGAFAVKNQRITAPETRRTIVNPAASVVSCPSAMRHRIELAAKAVRAIPVRIGVLVFTHSGRVDAGWFR